MVARGGKPKAGGRHGAKTAAGAKRKTAAKRAPGSKAEAGAAGRGERLQKILARAGLGSRRGCEEIILEGRVRVNGRVVTELGTRADASRDTITVGGKRVRGETLKYYAINKPKGVISTTAEDEFARGGRRRVIDLVPERPRVKPVGRLDVESEGLMLLTNDGDLANRLTHPRYGIERVYRAEVKGEITEDMLAKLRRGVRLAEGRTLPPKVRVIHKGAGRGVLEVVIKEGLNREVRRILAAVGLKVRSLKRIRLGPLSLGGLSSGTARELSAPELARLRKATCGPGEPPPPWLRRRRRRGAPPHREGRPRGK
ncbi:MAG: pseudouridine synthase [Planctomycetota bacterium]|jgi:23S rRNA pseudouridine2605 synthase